MVRLRSPTNWPTDVDESTPNEMVKERMAFTFKAIIYKVGINPVVDVPARITGKLIATKGYIPVKGNINSFPFHQTLCPVKDAPYRLYVNGAMMKGGHVDVGDKAHLTIEQDEQPPKDEIRMPDFLLSRLNKEKLLEVFEKQAPSRKKEVYRYLLGLKTADARQRNLDKLIVNLKRDGSGTPWIIKKRP